MNIGTYLPGLINTSIIAFADDLILLSPNLKQLQLMLTECERFGLKKGLRFNDTKTQFVISGKCPIPDPTILLNGKLIAPKDELKHLGFSWSINHTKRLTLYKHQTARISELWATTSSLISCGVRKMHPSTIISIFRSIILPKMMYGLEIAPLSRSFMDLLDTQCRCSLKVLLGLSKHSSNDINRFFNLNNISDIVNTRRINLLPSLMKNSTTSMYLLELLSMDTSERFYSILQRTLNVCSQEDVDVVGHVIGQNKFKRSIVTHLQPDKQTIIRELISNWNNESRNALKIMMESNICRL